MNKSTKSTIVIVAVTYGTDDSALQFAQNFSDVIKDDKITIIIVDNTERLDDCDLCSKLFRVNPGIIYIKPPTNLGYFGGANYGLREYIKKGVEFDWVIVSNVDIRINDEQFFSRLREMEGIENLGVVAPSIWSGKSLHDQNPKIMTRPSKYKMKFYRLIYQNIITVNLYAGLSIIAHIITHFVKYHFLLKLKRAKINIPVPKDNGCSKNWISIYAPQGACIIFAQNYFYRGGTLDYPMFLFYEEIFVAESALKVGLSIIYNPALKLFHEDHVSTNRFATKKIGKYVSKSINFIVETYFH